MKVKYFDCSVNDYSNRVHNTNSYGPLENDIMRDLGKYAGQYQFERIYDYKKAQIIITNTVYPNNILKWAKSNKVPLVKRMDGIYWKNELKHKNDALNLAANQSDLVIFISDYSRDTLKKLYSDIIVKRSVVVLNNVDDTIYYKRNNKNENFTMVSSCTNWLRDGKRLDTIIELSKRIDKNDVIKLIGHCDVELPNNIIKCGYIDNEQEMSNIIGTSDAFLSLFFRDSGSKVTCQAVHCQLPILHVSSGGLMELVKYSNGIIIDDYYTIDFLDKTPELDLDNVIGGYRDLKTYHKDIIENYEKRYSYQETISKYFRLMMDFI